MAPAPCNIFFLSSAVTYRRSQWESTEDFKYWSALLIFLSVRCALSLSWLSCSATAFFLYIFQRAPPPIWYFECHNQIERKKETVFHRRSFRFDTPSLWCTLFLTRGSTLHLDYRLTLFHVNPTNSVGVVQFLTPFGIHICMPILYKKKRSLIYNHQPICVLLFFFQAVLLYANNLF